MSMGRRIALLGAAISTRCKQSAARDEIYPTALPISPNYQEGVFGLCLWNFARWQA